MSSQLAGGDQATHKSQCQCKEGLLLYGRCFDKCPSGFHESGGLCVHDNEGDFLADPDAKQALQRILDERQC